MKEKFKYEIGDEIYFLSKNGIKNATVCRIHIEIDENGTHIFYGVYLPDNDKMKFVREEYCRYSRESLLKSL